MAVFNYTAHKKLWKWLAKHPEKDKHEWAGWKTHGYNIEQLCFACEYAKQKKIEEHFKGMICAVCPLTPIRETECLPNALFLCWGNADTYEKRSEYACQIAKLPIIREGVETI